MLQKKILVPLRALEKSLKSVHYALALARRLEAQVYILQQASCREPADALVSTLEETLRDLINSAREAGLMVSHHVAARDLKEEIVDMTREEGIDLLVFEANDEIGRLLSQVKSLVASQIIQVKEKDISDCMVGTVRQGIFGTGPSGRNPASEKGGNYGRSYQNSRY